MKTKQLLAILLLSIGAHAVSAAFDQAPAANQPAAKQCAYQPCPNTPGGEDPAAIDLREQERREKALQEGPDDIKRWKAIRLYSDSQQADELKLAVVKAAKFDMELEPKTGVVRFTEPGKSAAFRIASLPGEKGDVCPRYNLKVMEASAEHAIVRKSCPRYEYAPNRFHMAAEYFLFDWRSSTMRALWFAVRSSKDAPFPEAKPPVTVSKIANGYRFDWSGMFPDDNAPERLVISNSYTREKGPAGPLLVCTDLRAPKGEGRENEMCEGRTLDLVGGKPR